LQSLYSKAADDTSAGTGKKGGVKEDLSEVLPVYIFQHLHLPDGYPVEPHEAFVLQGDFIFFHADFETVQSCLVSNCG